MTSIGGSEPKYKFLTVTLSLPPSLCASSSRTSSSPRKSRLISSRTTAKDTQESLREKWELICQRWGMKIVRELVYIQNSVLEEHDIGCNDRHDSKSINESNVNQPNHTDSSTIVVDGCEAFKVKDQLVITNLIDQNGNDMAKLDNENGRNESSMDSYDSMKEIPSSIAQNTGIEPGDIIHAVYGMKNPKLGLLFGIMRDSATFQMTIKRMVTDHIQHDENSMSRKQNKHRRTDHDRDTEMSSKSKNQSIGENDIYKTNNIKQSKQTQINQLKKQRQHNHHYQSDESNQSGSEELDTTIPRDVFISKKSRILSDESKSNHESVHESDREFNRQTKDKKMMSTGSESVTQNNVHTTRSNNNDVASTNTPNDVVTSTTIHPVSSEPTENDFSCGDPNQNDEHDDETTGETTEKQQTVDKGELGTEKKRRGQGIEEIANSVNGKSDSKNPPMDCNANDDPDEFGEFPMMDFDEIDRMVEERERIKRNISQSLSQSKSTASTTVQQLPTTKPLAQAHPEQNEIPCTAPTSGEEPSEITFENDDTNTESRIEPESMEVDEKSTETAGNSKGKSVQNAQNCNENDTSTLSRNDKNQQALMNQVGNEPGQTTTGKNPRQDEEDLICFIENDISAQETMEKAISNQGKKNEKKSITRSQEKKEKKDAKATKKKAKKAKKQRKRSHSDLSKSYADDIATDKRTSLPCANELNSKLQNDANEDDTINRQSKRHKNHHVTKTHSSEKENTAVNMRHTMINNNSGLPNSSGHRNYTNPTSNQAFTSGVTKQLSAGNVAQHSTVSKSTGPPPKILNPSRLQNDTKPSEKSSLTSSSTLQPSNRSLRSRPNSPMVTNRDPTFIRPSTSTVVSTSSKAGLSSLKNTKLKRLWPDSLLFAKMFLKWSPPKAIFDTENSRIHFQGPIENHGDKVTLSPIPSTFSNAPDIIKHVSPHILEEGLNGLHQEFLEHSQSGIWKRHIFNLYLRSCTPVEPKTTSSASVKLYEFSYYLDGQRPPTNLGEMFAIFSPSWNRCCLGYIGSNDINSTFLTDQKTESEESFDLCKLWVAVSNSMVQNSGWLSESEMPARNGDGTFDRQKMYAINIGTCTDMMRQFEALKSLDHIKENLKRAVFCKPTNVDNANNNIRTNELPPHPLKPPSVISQVWEKISEQTNSCQLSAIEKVASGKAKDNITLIQGPPGTGKTMTIVALVSTLLNGSVPISGAKNPRTSGTKVQIGKALSSSEKSPILNAQVARRILVCSPSNHAVDELAWKLHKSALGTNGKPGSFNIIRFGMLPGEERHDGRNRRRDRRWNPSERDKFLQSINLDNIVNRIASTREVNDYAHHKDDSATNLPSSAKRQSRFINYSHERQKKLSQSHVICTTLSGAGSKAFAEAVSRDAFPRSEFDAVIIDEACQGSEWSSLIPLKFNPNALILVGDPKQLPVMTFSKDAERCKADRSLFERLQENGWPVHFLREQYRMHDEIARFPSKIFYNGLLQTSDSVNRRGPASWHHYKRGPPPRCHPGPFPPYLFWNVAQSFMRKGHAGGLSNNTETRFIIKLLKSFRESMRAVRNINIGVISFYNDQVSHINESLTREKEFVQWLKSNKVNLQVSTVDGFQGAEKDIIILSCVRSKWPGGNSSNQIGFLKDFRRVNVSLTRAKHSLWIVGNANVLKSDGLWNSLIDDVTSRKLMKTEEDLNQFMGRNHFRDQRRNTSKRRRR